MSVPKGEIVAWNFVEKMTNLFNELFDGKPCQSPSVAKA